MMFRILATILVSLSPVLLAQENYIRVRAMSLDNSAFPKTFVRTKDGFQAVDFSGIQPSAPYQVAAGGSLPVYYAAPSAEDKEAKPDAVVKLPEANGGILLFGWQTGEKRNFIALPDNLNQGGRDNWLLVNATGEKIAFQLGKGTSPTVVDPGKTTTHRVTVPFGEGAAVLAARIGQAEQKVIFSTYWNVYEDQRCIILFIQDAERIRVRQILDVTSVTKPAE
jgi:hypothetical protein